MTRFMAMTFLLLGWGFYEASGGDEFAGSAEASGAPVDAPVVVGTLEEVPEARLADIVGAEAAAVHAAPKRGERMPIEVVARAHMDFDAPLAPVLATVPASPEPVSAPADLREVAGSRVNMRAGPGTEHGVVTVLSRGARAEVIEEDGGWARVRADDGTTGWMAARLLSSI